MSVEAVGTVICSLARLAWQHPPLQRVMMQRLLAESAKLQMGQWALVMHALMQLDASRLDAILWRRSLL